MDPDATLATLGNPSEQEFWQSWERGEYAGKSAARILIDWLNKGGFKPRRWQGSGG